MIYDGNMMIKNGDEVNKIRTIPKITMFMGCIKHPQMVGLSLGCPHRFSSVSIIMAR